MTYPMNRAGAIPALVLLAGVAPAFASALSESSDKAFEASLAPIGRFALEAPVIIKRASRPDLERGTISPLLMTRADSAGSGVLSVPCLLGRSSGRCQLDSGAAMSLIEDNEESEGYPAVGQARFSGASGAATTAEVVRVPDVRAGSIDLGAMEMVRVGMGFGVRQEDPALIGITAFKRLGSLCFDFAARQLRAGAPSQGPAYKLYRSAQGHLILPVAIDGERGLGLWDTGASLTVVDPRFIAEHPEGFELLGRTVIRDIANKPMEAGLYRARSVKVGLYDFQDVVVAGVDSSAFFPEVRAKGLVPAILGYNLITRANWTMDMKRGLWAASRPIAEDYLVSTIRPRLKGGLASVAGLAGFGIPATIRLRLPRGRITVAAE